MTSADIRQSFLDFFEEKKHTIVSSASLMPDSPGLLFTNAGMNQFVPIFLNEQPCPYTPARAADTQKCIRAGGKHNDLEDVGMDTYHHTFFEMLGNWSFGDYFKQEAIDWAWELLTERWKLPKERLYATVYKPGQGDPADFDQQAYDIWKKIFEDAGLDPAVHIIYGNKKDNFWMMGDTGPCGPCSELHMDLTPKGDTQGKLVNGDDPRCIEIWNLVFIQFNANEDGTFKNLPACHVDTGMGFERVCSIMQGTKNFTDFSTQVSNYDTDVFTPIFKKLEELSGITYGGTLVPADSKDLTNEMSNDIAMRVIADHIRTLSCSIADGILPSNDGRGYVLRRILRRAVRYGRQLGFHDLFFYQLVGTIADELGGVFPELRTNQATVEKIIKGEEESFSKTLDRGIDLFNKIAKDVERSATVPVAAASRHPAWSGRAFPVVPVVPAAPGTQYWKRRLPHYEKPWGTYAISFSTHERKELSGASRTIVLDALKHFDSTRYHLLAACVMPDHVHCLIQPVPKEHDKKGNPIFWPLSDLMHSIKSFTAKEINKLEGWDGQVWENEYHDKLIGSDRELGEQQDYILSNPWRVRLVADTEDYQWKFSVATGARQDAQPGDQDGRAPGETETTGTTGTATFPGDKAFELFDTYGFPLDLTELMARERGITVDSAGFEACMTEQRERSKAAQKKSVISVKDNADEKLIPTQFVGFEQKEEVNVEVCNYILDMPAEEGGTVTARLYLSPTPFYGEMGGQVGDTGWIEFGGEKIEIIDSQKSTADSIAAITEQVGLLDEISFPVKASVDTGRRHLIESHHSATHILNWALREVLGTTVQQKGSYVGPDRLRFDFSHIEAMQPAEISKVEELVNGRILHDAGVQWYERPYADVKNDASIIQFFGDKYGDSVRVVDIGGFSKELCGGTHVESTLGIGPFRLVSEGAIAAGVRRIEAICGDALRPYLLTESEKLATSFDQLKAKKVDTALKLAALDADNVENAWSHMLANRDVIEQLREEIKNWEKEQAKANQAELLSQAATLAPEWAKEADRSGSVPILCKHIEGADGKFLQAAIGELKKHFDGVAVLAGDAGDRVALAVSVSPEYVKSVKAGDVIKAMGPHVGGKGGGRPEMAQGGGTDPSGIPAAFDAARKVCAAK
jgi:alanyl-tRNA synthetase/REP element-mobilizing transposase RayT